VTWTFCRLIEDQIHYPFSLDELRAEGIALGDRVDPRGLAKLGVHHVHIDPLPAPQIGYVVSTDTAPTLRAGFWVLGHTLEPLPEAPARAQAIVAMQAWAENFTGQFIAKYSRAEQLSFDRQEAMAQAYLAGTASDAQVRSLTIQAETKGVSLTERATVITAKAALFGDISDYTAGLRSRLEDQIAGAEVAQLQAILDAAAVKATQTAAQLMASK